MPRFADDPRRPPPPRRVSPTLRLELPDVSVIEVAELTGRHHLTADFHCVTTWSVRGLTWSGTLLTTVVAEALGSTGLDGLPPFAIAEGSDGYRAVFSTDDVRRDDVLLATHLDGRALDDRHGAPLRLVTPRQYGYKNVKHLATLRFVEDRLRSTLGPKEHLRARVDLEERHARLPNWMLRRPYRALVPITAILAERAAERAASHAENPRR